jgi:hypothetical protein
LAQNQAPGDGTHEEGWQWRLAGRRAATSGSGW